jgi:hypothetical protein
MCTYGSFHKHIARVTYGPSRISCIVFPLQCSQNVLAYLAAAISYARKMFMKLAPGVNVLKLFFFVA